MLPYCSPISLAFSTETLWLSLTQSVLFVVSRGKFILRIEALMLLLILIISVNVAVQHRLDASGLAIILFMQSHPNSPSMQHCANRQTSTQNTFYVLRVSASLPLNWVVWYVIVVHVDACLYVKLCDNLQVIKQLLFSLKLVCIYADDTSFCIRWGLVAAVYQRAVITLHSIIMKLHQKWHIRPVDMLGAPVDLVTSGLLSGLFSLWRKLAPA